MLIVWAKHTVVLVAVGSSDVLCYLRSPNRSTAQSIYHSLPGGGGGCVGEPEYQHVHEAVIMFHVFVFDNIQPNDRHFQLYSEPEPDIYDTMQLIQEGSKVIQSQYSICTK